jgi:feruloyl esterase
MQNSSSRSLFVVAFPVFAACVLNPTASMAASCESLQTLILPNTTITLAQTVAAGAFSPSDVVQGAAQPNATFKDLPAFCRVAATLKPSTDSDIKIEVWMPLANWNTKFQAVGNGGYAGSISYTVGTGGIERGMAEALRRGYATASTDTGHTGSGATAAPFLGHPEKVVDFGYRAVHEMTMSAKAIVHAFYGNGPSVSYWNGCSTGGRQGLMEAQRFPLDYDGIVAGSPANPQTRLASWNVYVGQMALKDPASTIPASKYPMIHRAVLDACDSLDGLKDGLISDPTRCRFDFSTLECKGQDSPSCLTAAQVDTARNATSPAVHPKTGETIFPGLALGSELGWSGKIGGPEPSPLGTELFKYVVFKDPNWNWRTFDFETAVALYDRLDSGTTNATNPDLRAFKQHGAKLLLFHGWADQNFSAQSTINYYNSVLDKMGSGAQTAEWLRLFLAPGMAHCGGGEGPNQFSPISALERWRESNIAPDQIIASHVTNGVVDLTRPLCPYPQVAVYKGTGSTKDAANFSCKIPQGRHE